MKLLFYHEVFFLVEYYCASELSIAKLVKFRVAKYVHTDSILDLIFGFIPRLNNAIILVVDEVSVNSEAPIVSLHCLVVDEVSVNSEVSVVSLHCLVLAKCSYR
jgi:hypothetical protein